MTAEQIEERIADKVLAELEAELAAIDAAQLRRSKVVRAIAALRSLNGLEPEPVVQRPIRMNGDGTRAASGTLGPAILDLLSLHPEGLAPRQIAEAIGRTSISTSNKLAQLLHTGAIRRLGPACYGPAR